MTLHKNFLLYACFFVLVILQACSRGGPPAPVILDQSDAGLHHVVAKGESAASIAERYGITLEDLASHNRLRPPYRIYPGQSLRIPQSKGRSSESAVPTPGDIKVQELEPLSPQPAIEGAEGLGATDTTATAADGMGGAAAGEGEMAAAGGGAGLATSSDPISKVAAAGTIKGFIWPVKGKIIKTFGPQPDKKNSAGINIQAPAGIPVVAVENGTIAHTGNQVRGFGNVVLIKHPNGWMSVYAHLGEIKGAVGNHVMRGQEIGKVGATGNVTVSQLHFELRKGTKPEDPLKYLGPAS